MRTTRNLLALALAAAVLPGCGGDDKSGREVDTSPVSVSAKAVFDPANAALPFPIDLLFAATADGSINIPGKPNSLDAADAAGTLAAATTTTTNPAFMADPQTSVNTMDGWSNTAPMVVSFSDAIASPSDMGGSPLPDGIRIFQTDGFDPGAAAGSYTIDRELAFGVDFVAGANGTALLVIPVAPLEPSTTFIVSIDSNLVTTTGESVTADDTYALLKGAFDLTAAVVGLGGVTDFATEVDGSTPCDFVLAPGDCVNINTEWYDNVVANANLLPISAEEQAAAAAGAALISGTLAALEAEADFSTVFLLEQLRRVTEAQLTAIDGEGVDTDEVVLTYTVSTQDVGTALENARVQVDAAGTGPTITVLNPIDGWDETGFTNGIEVGSPGTDGDVTTPADRAANIHLGNLNDMIQFLDPDAQNTSIWEADDSFAFPDVAGCNTLPTYLLSGGTGGSKNLVACNGYNPLSKVTDHVVPVLISTPVDALMTGACAALDGGDGLPVLIYQHGITSNRASMLAIADTLAQACIVGVAIDLPKHGILPSNDPAGAEGIAQLHQALTPVAVSERMVEVASPADECGAGTGVPTLPDNGNFYCPSGDNFINLVNISNTRDSVRQGVTDLHSLHRALSTVDAAFEASATGIGVNIDEARIAFAGVSLGSQVGQPFVATLDDPGDLTAVILNVSSGSLAKGLDGSTAFGPVIADGLYAGAGIAKPSGDYEGFLILAQTHVDNTDPINAASTIADNGIPTLFQEVVGDYTDFEGCIIDGTGCPDQVLPNNIYGSSFGLAYGTVDQIVNGFPAPTQTSFLPGQSFLTTPVALAGSDPLAQGTAFVALATLLEGGLITAPTVGATGILDGLDVLAGAYGGLGLTTSPFRGLELNEMEACGGAEDRAIVRFVSGDHGSLLRPDADLNTTVTMQTQLATFVSTDGASIAADANAGTADQVVRLGTGGCAP